jgi:hypothetical protein
LGLGVVAAIGVLRIFGGGWAGLGFSTAAFALICGSVVATLQHRTLTAVLPYLHSSDWLGWTVLGSALVWGGVFASTAYTTGMPRVGWWPSETGALLLGGGMGLVVGEAHWIHLREWVQRPWRWIVLHLIAWGLATPLLWFISADIGRRDLLTAFPAGSAVLLAAGLVIGIVQGVYVHRFDPKDEIAEKYTRSALTDIGSIDLTE